MRWNIPISTSLSEFRTVRVSRPARAATTFSPRAERSGAQPRSAALGRRTAGIFGRGTDVEDIREIAETETATSSNQGSRAVALIKCLQVMNLVTIQNLYVFDSTTSWFRSRPSALCPQRRSLDRRTFPTAHPGRRFTALAAALCPGLWLFCPCRAPEQPRRPVLDHCFRLLAQPQ